MVSFSVHYNPSPKRARRNEKILETGIWSSRQFSVAVIFTTSSVTVYSPHHVQRRGLHSGLGGWVTVSFRVGLCLKMRSQKSENQ